MGGCQLDLMNNSFWKGIFSGFNLSIGKTVVLEIIAGLAKKPIQQLQCVKGLQISLAQS